MKKSTAKLRVGGARALNTAQAPSGVSAGAQAPSGVSAGARALDAVSAFARFFMAVVWLYAGAAKLGDHMAVTQSIRAYGLFSLPQSDFLARIIGPMEIAGGLILLLGLFLRQASAVAVIVLLAFIAGIAQAWARGLVIDCGCFSTADSNPQQAMNYLATILRDLAFLGLTCWTIVRPWKKLAVYP